MHCKLACSTTWNNCDLNIGQNNRDSNFGHNRCSPAFKTKSQLTEELLEAELDQYKRPKFKVHTVCTQTHVYGMCLYTVVLKVASMDPQGFLKNQMDTITGLYLRNSV